MRAASRAAFTSLPFAQPGWMSTPCTVSCTSTALNVSSCSSPGCEPSSVYAHSAPKRSMSNSDAPWPISSSGVKPTRSVGRGSSGFADRCATAAMISATPALSSAPSSVSPLEVTMSWPTFSAEHRHVLRVEHRPAARQLDRTAVVVPVHDRLDAGAGRVRTHVHMRQQPDHARAGGAGQRREHVAVVVQVDVRQVGVFQLADEHAGEVELARRARAALAVALRLRVHPHVALEALQDVGRERLGQRRRVSHAVLSEPAISAAISATSVGVRPTRTPRASSASCFATAVPAVPETIAPAWPIVLPGGAVNPAM